MAVHIYSNLTTYSPVSINTHQCSQCLVVAKYCNEVVLSLSITRRVTAIYFMMLFIIDRRAARVFR